MKALIEKCKIMCCQCFNTSKKRYVLMAAIVVFSILYVGIGISKHDKYNSIENFEIGGTNRISDVIKNNDVYEQEFMVTEGECRGITVCFGTFEKKLTGGNILFSISSDSETVYSSKYELKNVKDNVPVYLTTNQIFEQGKYKLTLQFADIPADMPLVIYTADSNQYPEFDTAINGKPSDCDIAMTTLYPNEGNAYLIINIVLCVLVILTFIAVFIYFTKSKAVRLEKVFLLCASVLGMVYLIIIPIREVPDEPVHMDNAYAVSNQLLGIENEYSSDGKLIINMKMRQCDYETYFKYQNLDEKYITDYLGYFKELDGNKNIVSTDKIFKKYSEHLYIFGGIGIAIGRLLHFNAAFTFLLGDIFNLAFYIICIWYSIKKIPVAKELVFIVAILPMSMQQAASYSYDAPINGIFILLTSLALYIYSQKSQCVRWYEWLIMVAGSIYIIPTKAYAFAPAVFLLWIFIFSKQINRLSSKHKKVLLISIVVGGLCVLAAGGYLVFSGKLIDLNSGKLSYTDEKGFTIDYFLQNPSAIFSVIYNTIKCKSGFYIRSYIGQALGALDIWLPDYIMIPYCITLLIAIFKNNREELVCDRKRSFVLCAGGLLYLACTFGGMLFRWSPASWGFIEGVQGRYFIPVTVMIFIIFKHIKININSKIVYYLLSVSVISHIMIIISVYNCM